MIEKLMNIGNKLEKNNKKWLRKSNKIKKKPSNESEENKCLFW